MFVLYLHQAVAVNPSVVTQFFFFRQTISQYLHTNLTLVSDLADITSGIENPPVRHRWKSLPLHQRSLSFLFNFCLVSMTGGGSGVLGEETLGILFNALRLSEKGREDDCRSAVVVVWMLGYQGFGFAAVRV